MDTKETLTIENFLVIKEARLDVRKINIVVGPQASGKSIVAKLLYFFREIISEKFLQSILEEETEDDLIRRIETLFNEYFPEYTWKSKEFKIQYSFDGLVIDVFKSKSKRRIDVNVNDEVKNLRKELKSELRQGKDVKSVIYPKRSIFIPASRSFFTHLQRNVFSFLSEDLDVDPFIKKFGYYYETAKREYGKLEKLIRRSDRKIAYEKIRDLAKKILNGEFVFKDKQVWIKKDGELINLAHSSSGQQEVLPMLLILSAFPVLRQNTTYFIEDPESHLSPESQKHVVSIMAIVYNLNNSIFITTHSPYVLTAFNNLILARDVLNGSSKDKVFELVDEYTLINFEDVSAYAIEDGVLKSIKDEENRLIGVNVIDAVSNEFSEVFDSLLELLE